MKRFSSQFIQWIVLSIFVFAMVFSIYLGAEFYQSMHQEAEQSLNQRTILLYFNHRFNQSDTQDGLRIYDDLIQIDHENYFTLIYEENGNLVEQVSEVNERLEQSGQIIAKLSDLVIVEENNQIWIRYKDDTGQTQELAYTLKSMRGIQ